MGTTIIAPTRWFVIDGKIVIVLENRGSDVVRNMSVRLVIVNIFKNENYEISTNSFRRLC